ncbi:PKD domain-containing protein [bacterium]|nr:PKD domain-containing protein [bacterium]
MRHPTFRRPVLCAASLLICLLAACTGSHFTSESQPLDSLAQPPVVAPKSELPLPILPAPQAALLLQRRAGFTTADGHAEGSAYADELSHQRIQRSGSQAEFSPQWQAAAPAGVDLAFAIWPFQLPDYAGGSVAVDVDWNTAPEPGTAWLGLADFPAGRWHWQSLENGSTAEFADFSPYISDDDACLLAIVLNGSTPATLGSIQLDTNQPPTAVLSADPAAGLIPLTVEYDGSASTDSDNGISSWEWDLDGDGNFGESGAEATFAGQDNAAFTYESIGSHTARLRVTDASGRSDTAEFSVQARPDLPPTASLTADPQSGQKPLAVSFDGSASSDVLGSIADYEWDFDGNGSFNESGAEASARGLAMPEGYIYEAAGDYLASLRVTDEDGNSDEAQLLISVSNVPPVAVLMASQSEGNAPLGVQFDAGSSLDPDGSIVGYEWDFDGDGEFSEFGTPELDALNQSFPLPYTYSTPSITTVSLKVWDIDDEFDVTTLVITAHGWHHIPISSLDVSFLEYMGSLSAALVNSRPAAAFWTSAGGSERVRFLYCSSPLGREQTDWLALDLSGLARMEQLSLADVGGNPALAMHDVVDKDLCYLRATGDGSQFSHWSGTVTLDSTGVTGRFPQLAMLSGGPAIVHYNADLQALRYTASSTATGSNALDWSSPVSPNGTTEISAEAGRLLSANGNPAICYFNLGATEASLRFRRSSTASGTSAGDWSNLTDLLTGGVSSAWAQGFGLSGGLPMLAVSGTGLSGVSFIAAQDASGSSWGSSVLVDGSTASSYLALAEFNGNPAIAYRNADWDVKFIYSTTADGASAADWQAAETVQASPTADLGRELQLLTLASGQPACLYFNKTSDEVIYALRY